MIVTPVTRDHRMTAFGNQIDKSIFTYSLFPSVDRCIRFQPGKDFFQQSCVLSGYRSSLTLIQVQYEKFIFLSKHASGQAEAQPRPITDTERKYVYGILGIAKLFGCSLPTANRIKKSGKIDKAITQIGRKIIVDVELALELAGKKTGGRK